MVFPNILAAAEHYNEIPYCCIKDAQSMLDVGSSDGSMAKCSNYGRFFDKVNDSGNYLGIDIQQFQHTCYNILQQNILRFVPERAYDLIVALHILEHIDIASWKELLERLYSCVAAGGYLVVNVPFRQHEVEHTFECEAMRHKVFGIDKQMLERFLSGGRYLYSKGHRWHFRDKGEFFPYALLRFVFRVLTRHPYSVLRMKGRPCRIIGVWRKRFDE